jgi:MFS family permease
MAVAWLWGGALCARAAVVIPALEELRSVEAVATAAAAEPDLAQASRLAAESVEGPAVPASVRSIIGRELGKAPRGVRRRTQETLRAATGAAAGVVVGPVLGAAAGGYLLGANKNPSLQKARPILGLLGAALGFILGPILVPILFAKFFAKAKSYPAIKESR